MTLYVATRESLLVVDDPNGAPEVRERLADRQPECLAAHPAAAERVFCGTYDGGLLRSLDGGDTFERVGEDVIDPDEDPETAERRGVEDVSVTAVAIDLGDPETIWAGTEPSALFKSADGGDTWERVEGIRDLPSASEWSFPPRPYTHHVRCLALAPHDPGRVYVGIEAGALLVTPDDGETWVDRPTGARRDNHSLATHPDVPGRVYSAAGDGFAESFDGGETWERPQTMLEHGYVWGLAVDPGDPDGVLVSAAHGASDAHGHGGVENAESYLYRRVGTGWERLDGLPTGEGVLRTVLAADDPGEFYAANNHGIFRSPDGGDSWEAIDVDWRDRVGNRGARAMVAVTPLEM